MAVRDYEKLPVEIFGRQLVSSGDLDPVYVALSAVPWDFDQRARWLVAYWCFYHCGLASWASELQGREFTAALREAAVNETESPAGGRWPRGQERRHARGAAGIKMVDGLKALYGEEPEEMVSRLCKLPAGASSVPFSEIAQKVRRHVGFGPWIAFKVGDMLERVLRVPIDFERADVFMFRDPVRGAEMVYRVAEGIPDHVNVKHHRVVPLVVNHLIHELKDFVAPPHGDRPVGLQEVETILCKWKSHRRGHYPLWNDVDEITADLKLWETARSDATREFVKKMPTREVS